MCTVTWTFGEAGPAPAGAPRLELRFNRDERRGRPAASPPSPIAGPGGPPFLAALDPQGGGSWLAVNALGLCVALLNRYGGRPVPAAGEGPSVFVSRGQLVHRLATAPDLASAEATVRRLVTDEAFQPFTLLLLRPQEMGAEALLSWDGRTVRRRGLAGRLPFASSSAFDTAATIRGRRARFSALERRLGAEGDPDAGSRARALFHAGHVPERGARSVCMHRPEARTVSFSRVEVWGDRVAYHYTPGPPCTTPPLPRVSLPAAA